MRSTIALTIVAAAAAVSAQDCNPSYNVPGSTKCFTDCNISAGNTFMSGWTMDHTSPKFIESLTLMCSKGTPQYTAFMTKAGMCMAGCAGDDPELFNAEFAGACTWWADHKNDACDEGAATTTAPAATTTTAATDATTTAPADTTTAPATNGGTTASGASSAPAGSSSAAPAASSSAPAGANSNVAAPSTTSPAADTAGSAGNKLQISAYAVALVAGAGYLAL